MDYAEMASRLENLLCLNQPAVAISFVDTPPPGVARVSAAGPAGCAYWKLASEGEVFYTTSDDHLNCPIGAYTHGVSLPADKADELKSMIGDMIGMGYLKESEIPQIPHRTEPLQIAVYAPFRDSPCDPDVVVIRGDAKHGMLLTEAALGAGIGSAGGVMARPTCAFLPHALESQTVSPSFACIGNRVYTEMADSELYFAIPGAQVAALLPELEKIVDANQKLEKFHQARRSCN